MSRDRRAPRARARGGKLLGVTVAPVDVSVPLTCTPKVAACSRSVPSARYRPRATIGIEMVESNSLVAGSRNVAVRVPV
jgi:hypothetical protein